VNRLVLPALLAFWGVMAFLLWRSEYGVGVDFGTPVPLEAVWQRILTAPDDSALEIRHGRERHGRVVWAPNVGQELETGKVDDLAGSGQVRQATHYTIDLDGSLQPVAGERGFRFSSQARFATNNSWEAFNVRVSQRPMRWTLSADATNRAIVITILEEDGQWERSISFDELARPEKLLAELGAPWAAGLLAGVLPAGPSGAVGARAFSPERLAAGIKIEARQDWFEVSNSRIRAYQVRLRLTESLRATIIVSRAGEILRAEFPDHWVFINEKFLGL
jgi:hypothetical protein